jgi:hypothetical protein
MALVQKGTAVEVGFGSITYTGTIAQSGGRKNSATLDKIKSETAGTVTYLVTNQKKEITVSGVITTAGTIAAIRALAPGDVVTIDGVACYILDIDMKLTAKQAEVTLNLEKPVYTAT